MILYDKNKFIQLLSFIGIALCYPQPIRAAEENPFAQNFQDLSYAETEKFMTTFNAAAILRQKNAAHGKTEEQFAETYFSALAQKVDQFIALIPPPNAEQVRELLEMPLQFRIDLRTKEIWPHWEKIAKTLLNHFLSTTGSITDWLIISNYNTVNQDEHERLRFAQINKHVLHAIEIAGQRFEWIYQVRQAGFEGFFSNLNVFRWTLEEASLRELSPEKQKERILHLLAEEAEKPIAYQMQLKHHRIAGLLHASLMETLSSNGMTFEQAIAKGKGSFLNGYVALLGTTPEELTRRASFIQQVLFTLLKTCIQSGGEFFIPPLYEPQLRRAFKKQGYELRILSTDPSGKVRFSLVPMIPSTCSNLLQAAGRRIKAAVSRFF